MAMNGFLNIDKPAGVTSRDVVDRVSRGLGVKKCGHAGTLDPMATGVLVIALGKATRLVEYVQRTHKTYEAEFLLGQTSDTDDVEGTVTHHRADPPLLSRLRETAESFKGTIEQVPPQHSAKKVAGKRAYKLARQGKTVNLKPARVTVHELEVKEYRFPSVELTIECSSGTYIRSLARDLGEKLGVGALMSRLRRIAVGSFHVGQAVPLEQFCRSPDRNLVCWLETGVDVLPRVVLDDDEQVRKFQHGMRFEAPITEHSDEVAVFDSRHGFLGVGQRCGGNLLKPKKAGFAE